MPRTNDPLGIITGAGLVPPGSVSQSSITPDDAGHPSATLEAHVDDPLGAHPATAISIIDPYARYFMGPNVEGALNELAALVPPAMGGLGSAGVAWLGSTNTGVPDWGILKLHDGILPFTGNPAADAHAVYPYYYRSPVCPSGAGMTGTGIQVATDPTFNVYDAGFPAYTGGGTGTSHAGFATFPLPLGIGGVHTGYPTWQLMQAINAPAAVVSGIVSPADRGVLALVKWPSGGEPTPAPAASVADIQARCLAAILLGRGVTNNGCDGFAGGVFSEGSTATRAFGQMFNITDLAGGYTVTVDLTGLPDGPVSPTVFTAVAGAPSNPYEFTAGGGLATTMDNLALVINALYFPRFVLARPDGFGGITLYVEEIGSIGNAVVLSTSAAPADFTASGCSGGADGVVDPYAFPGRVSGQYNLDEIHTGISISGGPNPLFDPAAGQVRLLTDPSAVAFSPGTTPGGMPIFGATDSAIGTTTVVTWLSYLLGGGTAGNFFAYRLPYLKDYSVATGIHYTPLGETSRYTTKLLPASAGVLTQAGDYDDFTADFWAFQLARYRHRFEINPAAAMSRVDGSYAIVHFKKEAFFEAYVRDGVVPAIDQIYSVNLLAWTGNVPPYTLIENVVSGTISGAYPINRSEVVEDKNGNVIPAVVAPSYTLALAAPATTSFYSGIEYLVPIDVLTAGNPNVSIVAMTFGYAGLFDRGFRSHDKTPPGGPLAADLRGQALNQNTVFVSLSAFSYEGTEPSTSTITTGSALATVFPGQLGEIRRQRIEFGYADLTPAATADPALADPASYNFVAGSFAEGFWFMGDTIAPSFTRDARVRVFLRRPLVVDPTTGYSLPDPALGSEILNGAGSTVLFHSMQEGNAAADVPYGNAKNSTIRGLSTTKDKDERFLDEIYRYPESWAAAVPLPAATVTQLQGPGLLWGPGAIQVPVRPDTAVSYDGWFLQNMHIIQLDNATPDYLNALQVAGLPPRDPPYTEGLTAPFPSRGVLMYPKTNFSAATIVPVQVAAAASDYSVLTGDRCYIRAFDAGAVNVGGSTVRFRLWGIALVNFAYDPAWAPGAQGMAVMVKIPGLTTWMDAGRSDGAGPGKQDMALDGAGCLTVAAEGIDAASQLRYTDITLNVGPAMLFLNAEAPARCPVLVKVIIKDNATGWGLNFANVAATAATSTCRGLVGITVL
jgi:hypothetical protein